MVVRSSSDACLAYLESPLVFDRHLSGLKGPPSEDENWPENFENVQGIISLRRPRVVVLSTFIQQKNFFYFEFELPRAQPCCFALYQKKSMKGLAHEVTHRRMYSIPHMPTVRNDDVTYRE